MHRPGRRSTSWAPGSTATTRSVPYSVTTNGARGSIQLKLGLFGNFLGFGVARTLDADGQWAFVFSMSQYL